MPTTDSLEAYKLASDDVPLVVEALVHLQDAVDHEEELTEVGADRLRRYVDAHLKRLSLLTKDRAAYPDIAKVKAAPPIVITGAPRSGTTFLHSVLAQDPQHRAPLTWELEFPSPPPEEMHLLDDQRIAQWEILQSGPNASHVKNLNNKDFLKKHLIGATLPEECGAILGTTLRNPTGPWSQARVLRYYDWVVSTQMAAAYAVHKRWLQHLQWRAPRKYWLLKYPQHALALPQLAEAYPDVRIIQTHRSPFETVSSVASLIRTIRIGGLTRNDTKSLGQEMLNLQATTMQKTMDYREQPGSKGILNVGYRDLIANPMATVVAIYEKLGLALSSEAEERMQQFLRENPQDKHGIHSHNLSEYGLSEAQVRERMQAYFGKFADYL